MALLPEPGLRHCRQTSAVRSSTLRYPLGLFLLHQLGYGSSMAKRTSFHSRRVTDIPVGPWVPHSAELISSAAWKARPIHVVRLLDRIELEHCAHAGRENGYLTVPYNQFVEAGIGRRFIKAAIDEAVRLGLLIVERGLYRGGAKRRPSRYRLTYLKSKFAPAAGTPYYLEPTHDWRNFRPERRRENRIEWSPRVSHPGPPRVNSVSVEIAASNHQSRRFRYAAPEMTKFTTGAPLYIFRSIYCFAIPDEFQTCTITPICGEQVIERHNIRKSSRTKPKNCVGESLNCRRLGCDDGHPRIARCDHGGERRSWNTALALPRQNRVIEAFSSHLYASLHLCGGFWDG